LVGAEGTGTVPAVTASGALAVEAVPKDVVLTAVMTTVWVPAVCPGSTHCRPVAGMVAVKGFPSIEQVKLVTFRPSWVQPTVNG